MMRPLEAAPMPIHPSRAAESTPAPSTARLAASALAWLALCVLLAFALVRTARAAPPAPPERAAGDAVYVAALASPARTAKDRERDLRDRPADVLAFAGIAPGQRVADIFGAGGYYTEILSQVVGERGHVLLVNNFPYYLYAKDDYTARFADGRLPNVERSLVESCNLELAPDSLDAALVVMSYHDLYTYDPKDGWPRIDAAHFLEQIRRAVRPGGAFLIVDHAARAGTGKSSAQELHRIDEEFAIRDIESHGFRLEKRWDGLRNPADDRAKPVFDAAIRGHTDRFVHLYRRRS
jgi:predicted methyltransferase